MCYLKKIAAFLMSMILITGMMPLAMAEGSATATLAGDTITISNLSSGNILVFSGVTSDSNGSGTVEKTEVKSVEGTTSEISLTVSTLVDTYKFADPSEVVVLWQQDGSSTEVQLCKIEINEAAAQEKLNAVTFEFDDNGNPRLVGLDANVVYEYRAGSTGEWTEVKGVSCIEGVTIGTTYEIRLKGSESADSQGIKIFTPASQSKSVSVSVPFALGSGNGAGDTTTTEYDVWVNGTRFTSEKPTIECGGVGKTATYTPANDGEPQTVTLTDADITAGYEVKFTDGTETTDVYAGIYSKDSLKIVIKNSASNNTSTINFASDTGIVNSKCYGILVGGDLTIASDTNDTSNVGLAITLDKNDADIAVASFTGISAENITMSQKQGITIDEQETVGAFYGIQGKTLTVNGSSVNIKPSQSNGASSDSNGSNNIFCGICLSDKNTDGDSLILKSGSSVDISIKGIPDTTVKGVELAGNITSESSAMLTVDVNSPNSQTTYAAEVNGNIVNTGILKLTAENDGTTCYALYAPNSGSEISIKGGSIELKSGSITSNAGTRSASNISGEKLSVVNTKVSNSAGNILLRTDKWSESLFTSNDYLCIQRADNIPVESIEMSETAVTVAAGETKVLTAVVIPTNATNQEITWSSSSTGVTATKDSSDSKKCTVAGVTSGITATVTALNEASQKTGTTSVTVTGVAPTSVTITAQDSRKTVDPSSSSPTHTLQLYAKVLPSDASQTVTWTSNDSSTATVDANGLVTGVATGSAKITATASNGVSESFDVTVENTNVTITKSDDLVFTSLTGTKTAKVSVTPSYLEQYVEWSIIGTSGICTVNRNIGAYNTAAVQPLSVGSTVVRASVVYGGKTYATADFNVTVTGTNYAITKPSANNSLIWYYDSSYKSGVSIQTNIPRSLINKVTIGEVSIPITSTATTSSCVITDITGGTQIDIGYSWLKNTLQNKDSKYYLKVYYGTGSTDYAWKYIYVRSVNSSPITGDEDLTLWYAALASSLFTAAFIGVCMQRRKKQKAK